VPRRCARIWGTSMKSSMFRAELRRSQNIWRLAARLRCLVRHAPAGQVRPL